MYMLLNQGKGMKNVNIFEDFSRQAFNDKHVRKYGGLLLKHGFDKSAKLNPVSVWFDAAVATLEAIEAYLRYCQTVELVKQLEIANRTLEDILEKELKIEKLEFQRFIKEQTIHSKDKQQKVERIIKKNHISRETIRSQLESLQQVKILIQREKNQIGSFKKLILLQVHLDYLIDSTLTLMLEPEGE